MINRGYCKSPCQDDGKECRNKIIQYYNSCAKLDSYNWLENIPVSVNETEFTGYGLKIHAKEFTEM